MNDLLQWLADFRTFWENKETLVWGQLLWYFVLYGLFRYLLFDSAILAWHLINLQIKRRRWVSAKLLLHLNRPLVSILVPGKNEGSNLFTMLQSIRTQTWQNIEVIVVDDGSDDNSAEIARSLEATGWIDLFIQHKVRGGKASAANAALFWAKGEFALHLDADSSLEPDAVEKSLIPFYYSSKIGAVAGNLVVRNFEENLLTRLQALEYIKSLSIGRLVSYRLGMLRMVSGAFGTFRTDLLKRLGGWDIGPGLDGDLAVRIRKVGYDLYFEPQAICKTRVPSRLLALTRQRLRWNRSIVRFRIRRHADVYKPDAHFEPLMFLSFVDNVLFSIILAVLGVFYGLFLYYEHKAHWDFLLAMNLLLFFIGGWIKYLIVILFYMKRIPYASRLLAYVPLMVIYSGIYQRFLTLTGVFQELIWKSSYSDRWNPVHTSWWSRKESN